MTRSRRRTDPRRAVHVADDYVGVERTAAGDRRSRGVERAAAAVEDEIVVAAELVDVRERHPILQRHAAEHLLAPAVLAGGERGRRQVDDGFGARAHQLFDRIVVIPPALPEVAIVPDVFADADAQPPAAKSQDLRSVERLEVPVFVEDIVGGQKGFPKPLIDGAAVGERRRVEQRPSLVGRIRLGQADQHRREVVELARELVQLIPAAPDEAGTQQQIARQVADERQLRRDGEVGAPRARLADGVGNQPRVAAQVADRRVDLQQRNFHSVKRYLSSTHKATRPATQVIFFPSS